MSLNIIDLIKGQLGPALVSQAATQLGESESGISKAISGVLPAVVGGLANNASNPNVLDAITNAGSSGLLSNLVGGSSHNSLISSTISSIFGDHTAGVINSISDYAGISNSSAGSVLNMVTGAAVGTVGKYAADNHLGKSAITDLLSEQKGIVSTLLPAGLSLASLGLNWKNEREEQKIESEIKREERKQEFAEAKSELKADLDKASAKIHKDLNEDTGGGGSLWMWLLPLLLAVLLGWFLMRQCNKKDADANASATDTTMVSNTDTTKVATDTTNVANDSVKVDQDIDLNGVKIKGYKGGMEEKMITFLKSDGYKKAADDAALKNTWYDFDHVNFKIGSSTVLEEGSLGQLDNLLAIMKAFPDAKIKIGGYTDKTGKEAENVKLSKARAEYIKKWLTEKGVGAQILGADGYGSQFATVAATASNEERAVDRKMAVRFAK